MLHHPHAPESGSVNGSMAVVELGSVVVVCVASAGLASGLAVPAKILKSNSKQRIATCSVAGLPD